MAPKPGIPLCKVTPVKVPLGFDSSLCVWCDTSPREKPKKPTLVINDNELKTVADVNQGSLLTHQEKNQNKAQLFGELLLLKEERRKHTCS